VTDWQRPGPGAGAVTGGAAGLQQLAGDATMPCSVSGEAPEGRVARAVSRTPDSGKFPRRP
jgi:naphthoate synthase